MTVFAIAAVKNEDDIIADTLCHLLDQGVAHAIVSDGMSTDGTRDKLRWVEQLYPERVTLLDDPDPVFRQAAVMNGLVSLAGAGGAEWIIPFDADEYWCSTDPARTIVEVLEGLPSTVTKAYAPMLAHVDEKFRHQFPKPLPKVAFRWAPGAVLTMGQHDVHLPGCATVGDILVREIQFRGREHFRDKVRQRIATLEPGLGPDVAAHYRALDGKTDAELDAEWDRLMAEPTILDPIPR